MCSRGQKRSSAATVGFIVLFKWALKTLVMFLVGSNYINTEHNYGRLIEFLSQISTCLI